MLDVCAAPGGKTTDIAMRVGPSGKVTAVDISEPRLNLLRENLTRLKIENVTAVKSDGTKYKNGEFKKILIDAPCSGTGVFRKFPEGRWITTQEDITRYATMQIGLLKNAASILAPGGAMVYSTCSVLKGENENIIAQFLKETPEFEVTVPETFKLKDVIGEDNFLRTYPGLKYLDNIFAAHLTRK